MATNRSGFSIDAETASEAELNAEIARLVMSRRFLKTRFHEKSLFSRIRLLEAARARHFGVPAPRRTLRART